MIDAVYTWVDGAWPGYDALLRRYTSDPHDLNPNRYRDNIGVLKYSLRSLERYAPWIRRVFVVTARPQTPTWLDASAVQLVHHDEIMPAEHVPTFSSFAIISHLHRLPGLSERFVYIEDDQLFASPIDRADFFDDDGRPRVYSVSRVTIASGRRHDVRLSPWNRAVAYSNYLLDERYGARPRRTMTHTPMAIEVKSWRDMMDRWPDACARTAASRFRATDNVAPEHLYAHFLLEEGRGVAVPQMTAYRRAAYHPLNNVLLFQRASLARLRWQRPKFICLNDNFGEHANPRVVRLVTDALERMFPDPSRFERR